MKPTFQRLAILGVLGMSLCTAASALAQERPGGAGGPPSEARAGEHQKMFEDMKHRREQRLHDLLQIKPDQETAFGAFVTGLEALRPRPDRGPAQASAEPEDRKPLTTPERLDRAAQRMSERQQRAQKAAMVIKTFYAALTPDQRKAFDSRPLAFGGGGHMRMRGHGWGPDGAPPR
jgi:hypothetical protein